MSKTVEVEIYGQRYAIRGEAEDAYVRRLAHYVDDHMKRLAEGMKTATPVKLAVLTAINLAHQLFESEKKRVQGEADFERRMDVLMESLEEHVPTSLFR
ncbi:MAG: cell division protein ZapA [Nitrospira sp.]|nr:cell division protein ZapA [Nitrospira sp.]MCP9441571.1 cell division protein ZapA [Nitrospira sp.]